MEIDHQDIEKVSERLKSTSKQTQSCIQDLSDALTVIKFSNDNHKNLLAEFTDYSLPQGKAEAQARANPAYIERFKQLQEDFRQAQSIILADKANDRSWETARSLLSVAKSHLNKFQG